MPRDARRSASCAGGRGLLRAAGLGSCRSRLRWKLGLVAGYRTHPLCTSTFERTGPCARPRWSRPLPPPPAYRLHAQAPAGRRYATALAAACTRDCSTSICFLHPQACGAAGMSLTRRRLRMRAGLPPPPLPPPLPLLLPLPPCPRDGPAASGCCSYLGISYRKSHPTDGSVTRPPPSPAGYCRCGTRRRPVLSPTRLAPSLGRRPPRQLWLLLFTEPNTSGPRELAETKLDVR